MTIAEKPDRPAAYEPFFGLSEPPFSLAPDPRFLFESESHSAALAQVAYALERREPLVVITGDIGTGKTLLCRTVLQRLPFKTFLSVIHDPLLDSDDLVKELLKDFGVISKDPSRFRGASRHELVETLHTFLSSLAPIQAHAVVMIDEAQHLRPDVLEQIRLLSNIDDENGTSLQIILVGQTDLEPLLSRPELRQLHQRVSRRFALGPLNRDEVQQYIGHRIARASQARPEPVDGVKGGVEFTAEAVETVSQLSEGVPRVINLLCDRALELAFAARQRTIDGTHVHAAAQLLGIEAHADAGASAAPAAVMPPEPAPEAPIEIVTWHEEPAVAEPGNAGPARASTPQYAKYAVLVVLLAALAGALLFGLRVLQTPAAETPSPRQPSAASPAASAPAPKPAAPVAQPAQTTPAGPGVSAPADAAAAQAAATDTRFDIVVASFRTEARAASVAEQVSALGVPVHQREADGWQQVVAGPFTSRTDAEEAQGRIHGAGLTGTQIVPVARPLP